MPGADRALHALGTHPNLVPLAIPSPTAEAGRTLRVIPQLVELHLVRTGSSTYQLALPNDTSRVGHVLGHQVLGVDLGPAGSLGTVVATNALAMTIGLL